MPVPTRLSGAPSPDWQIQYFSEIFEDSEPGDLAHDVGYTGDGRAARARAASSHGLQRMTARVLAALLFTEQPTMTMGELADQLRAKARARSPGALKMLTSVGLVERVPAPGSRRDHYRLRDDAWVVQYTNQNEVHDCRAQYCRGRHCSRPRQAACPASASPRCVTSMTFLLARSRRYWIAGKEREGTGRATRSDR